MFTEKDYERADYEMDQIKDRYIDLANDRLEYKSLGQNPRQIPNGRWVRSHISPSGNIHTYVCDGLKLQYQIISH